MNLITWLVIVLAIALPVGMYLLNLKNETQGENDDKSGEN